MSTEAKIPTPIEVIETLDMAANHSDIVNIVKLFTSDATISLQPAIPPFKESYKGRDDIQSYFTSLITKDYHVSSSNFRVAGNEVTWDSEVSGEQFRKIGLDKVMLTHHAVLTGALIQSLTVTPSRETVQKAQAAMAAQAQP